MTFECASSFLPLTVIYMLITSDMKVTKYIGIFKPGPAASYTQIFTKALCSGSRPELTAQGLNQRSKTLISDLRLE